MADKKNIFGRIGQKFKEVIAEFKRVQWPDKKKLKNTSAVVLLVILFFAVYLTLIGDGGRWLLDKVGFYDVVETTATTETSAEETFDPSATVNSDETSAATEDTATTTEPAA
ncbi:MAG: preprotein translocase subunit SecE [Clostridiales bacterium]|nr:preprotein translocase subunit SecE [Clostridiales bacterium]